MTAKGSNVLVAYRGPSLLDGTPIRVIVYTLAGSKNAKTGPMVQVMIAPDDEPPHHAVKSGRDHAVCGECAHRPMNEGTCYVVTPRFLPRVWSAANSVPANLTHAVEAIARLGLPLRLGSWGDPAAVPFEVIEALVRAAARGRSGHTGYTHAWRTCDRRLSTILMASVSSKAERAEASARGWRTYRIREAGDELGPGEIVCPASNEAGHRSTCAKCLMCRGANASRDIAIVAHGSPNKVNAFARLVHLRRKDELSEAASW